MDMSCDHYMCCSVNVLSKLAYQVNNIIWLNLSYDYVH